MTENTPKPQPMSNSKRMREELFRLAGYIQLPNGKWGHPALVVKESVLKHMQILRQWPAPKLVCARCGRRVKPSSANNLQCNFCGGSLLERP